MYDMYNEWHMENVLDQLIVMWIMFVWIESPMEAAKAKSRRHRLM